MKYFSEESKSQIVSAYLAGHNTTEIAERFGCATRYPGDLAKRMGLPLRKTPQGEPLRFLDQAVHFVGGDCLNWPYGLGTGGYPQIRIGNLKRGGHRVVCERVHGDAPTLLHEAAHKCGNRRCINPGHLRWATGAENQADRLIHGTYSHGEHHNRSKLTDFDVARIRAMLGKRSQTAIAAEFGVHNTTVSRIARGKGWRGPIGGSQHD